MSFKSFSTAQDAAKKDKPADKSSDAPTAGQPAKAPAEVAPPVKS